MAELTYDDASHLLRRMGFGGSPGEIDSLVQRGRDGAVDYLLNFNQIDNSEMEALLGTSFDFSNPLDFPRFNRSQIQRWWLTRMVYSNRQFEEKMTLFWHNHFATGAAKVGELLIFVQNLTLRSYALDRFDVLLEKVAKDPAMLYWLDGITNVRGNPNENFARELQELFGMGISDVVTGAPNYSENDVKEIARAFTGWKFFYSGQNGPDKFRFDFFVNPNEHDNGAKTIYGETLNFGGEDVISRVAARRSTARFLVKKFFEFFVYPLTNSSADKATIEEFASIYVNRNHSIKELARSIFTSDEFFSDRARFGLVKSPVELVVSSVRMLGVSYNPGPYQNNPSILGVLTTYLGQELFNPPDVSGWKLNLGWVSTATLLNRFNFADLLATSRTADATLPGLWLSHDRVKKYTKATAKKTLKKFLSVLGPLQIDSATSQVLNDYLQIDSQGNPAPFSRDDKTIDKKVRGLVHLIMCLSEFQLN